MLTPIGLFQVLGDRLHILGAGFIQYQYSIRCLHHDQVVDTNDREHAMLCNEQAVSGIVSKDVPLGGIPHIVPLTHLPQRRPCAHIRPGCIERQHHGLHIVIPPSG